MQIIDMPWEKKNLGVSSIEFRFDGSEDILKIDPTVYNNNKYDYQICRVPANSMSLVYFLQDKGFRYSETAFELTADLRKDTLPSIYKKYLTMLAYHEANEEELAFVYKTIRGGVFDTDRIALDTFFSPEKSGNRFANWCQQEIEIGSSKCYIVKTKLCSLGFFVLRGVTESVSDSFLAALFDRSDLGLGFPIIYYPMVQAREEGKRKITTRVSSNNIDSLKTHLEMGYKIKNLNYLFVKHLSKSK